METCKIRKQEKEKSGENIKSKLHKVNYQFTSHFSCNLSLNKQPNGTLEIIKNDVVAILTPHFLKRCKQREVETKTLIKIIIHILNSNLSLDDVNILNIGDKNIVFKKIFNKRRGRFEIEFISITPDVYCFKYNHIFVYLLTK